MYSWNCQVEKNWQKATEEADELKLRLADVQKEQHRKSSEAEAKEDELYAQVMRFFFSSIA